jgi:hypothetical protein
MAAEQLLRDRGEPVDIAGARRRATGLDLGRRVARRAAWHVRRMTDRLGDPEVEEARPPIGAHEDVGRLQVEMDEAVRVERLDRVGELDHQERDLPLRQRRARELIERLAFDVLERDERVAERLVDAEHRDDRRMVERLQASRLREEVTARVGVLRIAEDLQGDRAVARLVVGAPDVRGAAGAEVRGEPVASRDHRADLAAGLGQDDRDVRALHRTA